MYMARRKRTIARSFTINHAIECAAHYTARPPARKLPKCARRCCVCVDFVIRECSSASATTAASFQRFFLHSAPHTQRRRDFFFGHVPSTIAAVAAATTTVRLVMVAATSSVCCARTTIFKNGRSVIERDVMRW